MRTAQAEARQRDVRACMQAAAVSDRADATAMMRAGHLLVVRSLLRVLPHSTHAKAALDAVVDACAAMQNLRSIIVRYRANMLKESREDKRAKILSVVTVRPPPLFAQPDPPQPHGGAFHSCHHPGEAAVPMRGPPEGPAEGNGI